MKGRNKVTGTEAVKTLQDFEWGSIARYMGYLEQVMGLTVIDDGQVNMVRMPKAGPSALIREKEKLLGRLRENARLIEVFVGRNRDALEEGERVVLRTMYRRNSYCIGTVLDQIEVIQKYVEVVESGFMECLQGEEYDGLF